MSVVKRTCWVKSVNIEICLLVSLQFMFKVSAFSWDAKGKAFTPFVDGFVDDTADTLLHCWPRFDRSLLQLAYVPVSFNFLSNLFSARNFQPLVGNSLINRFVPQPFNSYKFLINIQSSWLKTTMFTYTSRLLPPQHKLVPDTSAISRYFCAEIFTMFKLHFCQMLPVLVNIWEIYIKN